MKLRIMIVSAVVALSTVGLYKDSPVAEAKRLPTLANQPIADVTERVLPSVVSIATRASVASHRDRGFHPFFGPMPNVPRRGLGSGVIVSAKGYILTNNHVVDRAETITVKLSDGRETTAKVVGTDPKSDLAVLKLEKRMRGLRPLPIGSSSKLRLGEVVLAVGNPMGVGQSVSMGIVSAKGRGNVGIVDYEDFIQTDAAINPGNSGGALVNLRGELVGINTAILSRTGGSQGIGFAIPSDMAKPIMEMLIKNGRVIRGYLGVSIQQLDERLAGALGIRAPGNQGVLIADVLDGTPASRAGLRRNDVVVELNGKRIEHASKFRNLIAAMGAGTVVNVEVIRGSNTLQIPVELGQLPTTKSRSGKESESMKLDFGVRLAPLNSQTRGRFKLPKSLRTGVVVVDVSPASKAKELGLRPGDVILEVNRKKIRSPAEFKRAYRRSKKTLAVLLYRDGMTSYIVVTQ